MLIKAVAIFILQLIYVPILTLRTTLVVKGEMKKAPLVGFLEAIIYIVSIGIVFSDLTNMYNIIAYVIGYAVGIYLGSKLESKLAIGYRVIQIYSTKESDLLVSNLRANKFGATTFMGTGINNEPRFRIEVLTHRVREKEVIKITQDIDEKAFIVSYDLTQFKGGYLHKR